MEELQTITQVTRAFSISTRTLRYYEQIGLLQSKRMEGYSYRVYDEEACLRLRQIIILRKLRIPLKQIAVLLTDNTTVKAIEIFTKNISELDEEIDSLSTIRTILKNFVDELQEKSGICLKTNLFNDADLLSMVTPLPLTKINFKEETTMNDLNKASENLNKLTDKQVRIVYLPPAAVATYQYAGDEPEMHVHEVINKFVRDSSLVHVKPDLRHYGFNSPNPKDETGYHGYEIWVTVPDDMDIPEPLVKKYFEGGLYAAHMIPFGAFEEWDWLSEWLQSSEKYKYRGEWNADNMFGFLEESINYVNRIKLPDPEAEGFQLDLLIPIQEKDTEIHS